MTKRIDGLVALVAGVSAFLAAQGSTAVVDFGWKARSKQLNQGAGGRVVFIPGKFDPSSGDPKTIDAGAITKPRMVGDNPRALAWWHRAVTVCVWGLDTTDAATMADDLAQYAATVDLFEQTIQAIHRAVYVTPDGVQHNVGLADVVLEGAVWTLPPVEMAFGRELVATLTLQAPLYDVTLDTATPKPAIARGSLT